MSKSTKKMAACVLAEEFEQFLFERGEYDYKTDYVRWINLQFSRVENVDYIAQQIRIKNVQPMIDYLNDEITVMDEDDELISKAKYLVQHLQAE